MRGGSRYSTSRQKACTNCANAKSKCDRGQRQCSRCATRGIQCVYLSQEVTSNPPRLWNDRDDENATSSLSLEREGFARGGNRSSVTRQMSKELEFTNVKLCCPVNVDDIRNRWLNSFVPIPGQKPKQYPIAITSFISKMLKSYAAVAAKGRTVPPFIHPLQLHVLETMSPLSTCLSVVRMCEQPAPGSGNVVAGLLRKEMASLYDDRVHYDNIMMLAAFQAYLIYTISLFFVLNQGVGPLMREAMMNLQDLAGISCRHGLVCNEEQQRTRPIWQAWIIAEAKRRTLFTMYLLDSAVSSLDGLPTFLGTELHGLPAPAAKMLWEARDRETWETSYNLHLADWISGNLGIHELWPISTDMEDNELCTQRMRVDRWLEDVDEYGTMLYAVTSCTHGT